MNPEFDIRRFLLEDEEKLSPFAKKSSETLGRKYPMKRDPFRLEFARDETRILHSPRSDGSSTKRRFFSLPITTISAPAWSMFSMFPVSPL
jgi:hypothetical protein